MERTDGKHLQLFISIQYRRVILASFTTANSEKRQKRAVSYMETTTVHLSGSEKSGNEMTAL